MVILDGEATKVPNAVKSNDFPSKYETLGEARKWLPLRCMVKTLSETAFCAAKLKIFHAFVQKINKSRIFQLIHVYFLFSCIM